jgi:hypothetical protein
LVSPPSLSSIGPDSPIVLADLSSPFFDLHRHASSSLHSTSLLFLVIRPNALHCWMSPANISESK